jgi:hypothetical protein
VVRRFIFDQDQLRFLERLVYETILVGHGYFPPTVPLSFHDAGRVGQGRYAHRTQHVLTNHGLTFIGFAFTVK